jgi:hypothetical protein
VLAVSALAALGAAGCGRIMPWSTPPKPAPDVGVLAGVIAAEHSMISAYRSVISDFPALGPVAGTAGGTRGRRGQPRVIAARYRAIGARQQRAGRGTPARSLDRGRGHYLPAGGRT